MKGNIEAKFNELINKPDIHYILGVKERDVVQALRLVKLGQVSMNRKIDWLERAGYTVEVMVSGKLSRTPRLPIRYQFKVDDIHQYKSFSKKLPKNLTFAYSLIFEQGDSLDRVEMEIALSMEELKKCMEKVIGGNKMIDSLKRLTGFKSKDQT